MDIGTFAITRVIIHKIPRAKLSDKTTTPAELSDLVTALDADQRNYFEKRIKSSMQKAFEVVWDSETDSPSPVPAAIMGCFDDSTYDEEQFVEQSRLIATHLHSKQLGGSPSGLLTVAEGTIGSGATGAIIGRCIVVLKLELESGISVDTVQTGGKSSLKVRIEDVTLTETTRVFKAGLFNRFNTLPDLKGWVSDAQLGSATAGRVIADFFLEDFLGCAMKETDEVVTMKFAAAADDFTDSITDEEKKFRYLTAIRSELESNNPTLDPEKLANDHFDVDDRDNFINRFKLADGQIQQIHKNIDLIRREVTRTWVDFDDGVRVTGPPEAVERYMAAIRGATNALGDPIITSGIKKIR